jgi:hypothetical protein
MLGKVDFKAKRWRGNYIMIKGATHSERLNIYATNNREQKFMRQKVDTT